VDSSWDTTAERLPSPEALKHKILIKCHKPVGNQFSKVSHRFLSFLTLFSLWFLLMTMASETRASRQRASLDGPFDPFLLHLIFSLRNRLSRRRSSLGVTVGLVDDPALTMPHTTVTCLYDVMDDTDDAGEGDHDGGPGEGKKKAKTEIRLHKVHSSQHGPFFPARPFLAFPSRLASNLFFH
jgi:hypothetical protein